ncbi:MAG TPA: hypothetical protein VE131_06080, partial [Terriglobales bacterium]|nr:hypothetical protein [Terriglobales bacterium]
GIDQFESLRKEKIPCMKGTDQRGWIKALECANLAWVGEMVTRSACERRETRGQHYREDHPDQDPRMLSWMTVYKEGNEIICKAQPVPFLDDGPGSSPPP